MENEIKDAEIEEVNLPAGREETPEEKAKKAKPSFAEATAGKRDFYVEMALFLILGVLIGIAVKNEAGKRITIGYDDYRMKLGQQHYNINKLQTDLIKKQSVSAEEQNSGEGATREQQ